MLVALSALALLGAACRPLPFVPPGTGPATTAAGTSPFATRGIIEGAYAVPYTHAQRTSMLTWMGAHDLNTYVHAPKLDPYADTQWRTPYPTAAMADFATEIAQANGLGISWVPAMHPGADLCFSCTDDREALAAKFQPFIAAGSRTIMVGFDDLTTDPPPLPDRVLYGSGPAARGAMTADLLNAMRARFPSVRVLTVLTEFDGTTTSPFLRSIADDLDPAIDVFWTGPSVVSPVITVRQAQAIEAVLGRRVLVWDNYPVSDYSGGPNAERRLNLGPFEGLDPNLATAVEGIVSNVQSPWATNTVPVATFASYVADPTHYQPEPAWRAALAAEGGTAAAALTKLAENSRSSLFDPIESIVVGPLLERVRLAFAAGQRDEVAEQQLRAELAAEIDAARTLRTGPDVAFATGAARFIDVFEQNARAATAALDLATASVPTITLRTVSRSGYTRLVSGHVDPPDVAAIGRALATLTPLDAARRAAVATTHGDRSGGDESVGPGNRVDLFVDAVLALPRPSAPAAPTILVNGLPSGATFTVSVASGASLEVVAADPSGARTRATFTWHA